MDCPNCHTPVQAGWKICPACTTPLEQILLCQSCGAEVQDSWKICPMCTDPLELPEPGVEVVPVQDTASLVNVAVSEHPLPMETSNEPTEVVTIARSIDRLATAKGRKERERPGTVECRRATIFHKGIDYLLEELVHREYESDKDMKICKVTRGGSVLFEWYGASLANPEARDGNIFEGGPWIDDLIAAANELDPQPTISFQPGEPLKVGATFELSGSITNQGGGPALNVSGGILGNASIEPARIDLPREIGPGATLPWALSIAPKASGDMSLPWELIFDDVTGVSHKATGHEKIVVVEPEQVSTISVTGGTFIQNASGQINTGDVKNVDTGGGDYQEEGAVKQLGDGIITQEENMASLPGLSPDCPFCVVAQGLNPVPPSCPGCGKTLTVN